MEQLKAYTDYLSIRSGSMAGKTGHSRSYPPLLVVLRWQAGLVADASRL